MSVCVSGKPGWKKKVDAKIRDGREQLRRWRDDPALSAYARRAVPDKKERMKLIGVP